MRRRRRATALAACGSTASPAADPRPRCPATAMRRRDRRRRLHRPLAAYYLPSLSRTCASRCRARVAGFGPSGRNGGWVSAGSPAAAPLRAPARRDAVRRGERGWPTQWARSAESPRRGDRLRLAAQRAADGRDQRPAGRAPARGVARRRAFGLGEDDCACSRRRARQRVGVAGARAASFTPHCAASTRRARARPGRRMRAAGLTIYERTAAEASTGPRALRRRHPARRPVLRATEAYTVEQPGSAAASCRSTR